MNLINYAIILDLQMWFINASIYCQKFWSDLNLAVLVV